MTDEKRGDRSAVGQMLLAHQCRCTGWQTIVDAVVTYRFVALLLRTMSLPPRRASLEGGVSQSVGPGWRLVVVGSLTTRPRLVASSRSATRAVSGWSARRSTRRVG